VSHGVLVVPEVSEPSCPDVVEEGDHEQEEDEPRNCVNDGKKSEEERSRNGPRGAWVRVEQKRILPNAVQRQWGPEDEGGWSGP